MNISLLAFLEFFSLAKKTDFWPVFRFSAERKNGRFSAISHKTGCEGPSSMVKSSTYDVLSQNQLCTELHAQWGGGGVGGTK